MDGSVQYHLNEINRLVANALIRCRTEKQRKDLETITEHAEEIRKHLCQPSEIKKQ